MSILSNQVIMCSVVCTRFCISHVHVIGTYPCLLVCLFSLHPQQLSTHLGSCQQLTRKHAAQVTQWHNHGNPDSLWRKDPACKPSRTCGGPLHGRFHAASYLKCVLHMFIITIEIHRICYYIIEQFILLRHKIWS